MPRVRDSKKISAEKQKLLFLSSFQAVDKRSPTPITELYKFLQNNQLLEADHLINQYVDEFIDTLRDTWKYSGVSISCFADYFLWAKAPASRTLSTDQSHHISFNSLKKMADLFSDGCISKMLLGDANALPLILPNKHVAWINKLQFAPVSSKKTLIENLRTSVRPEKCPESVADYERLIAIRIAQYCESIAINARDLGVQKYAKTNRTFRIALQNTVDFLKFKGRIQAVLYFSVMGETSPDYFLCPDYSTFPGKFVNCQNQPVIMDKYSRTILSILLNCNDETANKIIAHILAGDFGYCPSPKVESITITDQESPLL